jgi:serine protease Do
MASRLFASALVAVLGAAQAQAAPSAPGVAPRPGAPASFADLVERVSPAVVSVEITARVPLAEALGRSGADDPFASPPEQPGPDQPTTKAEALCSGFFISASGYLVTNDHCVKNETALKVTLKDGRVLPGRLVGVDEATDLAVIKVEGQGFTFIGFADKARPRVGDWAIAIGNPYGLSGTATAGIVSANAREIGSNFNDFIQIDTPINKGNSGGPTFDTAGRVIGVNTIIVSEGGGSSGIGFAIPADTVERVTHQLIAQGRVSRGYLGAMVQDLSPDLADGAGLPGCHGALVAQVTPGGPAERAGVRTGDVLTGFNGSPVASSTDLTRRIAASTAGQSFTLALYRDGQPRSLQVTAGLRPDEERLAQDETARPTPKAAPSRGGAEVLGAALATLDEETRRRYDLPADAGAVVEGIVQGSEAAVKGLQPGMVVVRAGDHTVHNPDDVTRALVEAQRQGRPALLLGVRSPNGATAFLALRLSGFGGKAG